MAATLKVGIVANEFFDPSLGRVGGFGWAAKKAAEVFKDHPSCSVDVSFITPEKLGEGFRKGTGPGGIPLYSLHGSRLQKLLQMFRVRADVLLTVDFRSNYGCVFKTLPFTPVITWVRDPRTQSDIEKVQSLKIPGKEHIQPAGIGAVSTRGLSAYRNHLFRLKNRVILANKMSHMKETNEEVYNIPGSDWVLPNPSVVDYSSVLVKKANKPTVVYVGRLDPIKRPWLFVELARRLPEVDFMMLGKNHFEGVDGWEMDSVPENLQLLGHVTGEEKAKVLSGAWIIVNTSIHEESPVSVFEALAYETALICYEDWGGIVSRYGISIGQRKGTGLDGLPDLVAAVSNLLEDEGKRANFGKKGRAYVEKEHNDRAFLSAFRNICLHAGVKKAKWAIDI